MRRLLSPGKLLLAGGLLAVITLGVLWLAPSGDYLLLPDEAHPVAPLVTVEKPKRGGGKDGIYFVDLLQRRATLLESIFPSIRDGATLVPEDRVNPHGIAESVRRQADLGQMARSQEIAAAVALKELGYDVKVRENGAFVASVYSDLPALGKVVPGEVIVAVDGKPVRSTLDLQRLIGERPPGTTLTLTLRSSDAPPARAPDDGAPTRRTRSAPSSACSSSRRPTSACRSTCRSTRATSAGPRRASRSRSTSWRSSGATSTAAGRSPPPASSRSTARCTRIGGIKQKTIGARAADVDVFLVPAENAAEARAHADGLRIVPVRSVEQAVQALAKLPAASS